MPYPDNRLSEEEHRLRSKQITLFFLRSTIYQNCQSIHLYESLKDEVDTQYILNHIKKSSRDYYFPTKDPYQNQRTDVIVVPGRRFDKYMNRKGRGCGYYDKFLHNTNAIKVGICYSLQLSKEKLVCQSWDVPMDMIITEDGIITKKDTESFPYPSGWPFFMYW